LYIKILNFILFCFFELLLLLFNINNLYFEILFNFFY